ncbi:MAG: Mut7-C RNAse domain-containing protein [Candidatus Thorarchaeota archaeon]
MKQKNEHPKFIVDAMLGELARWLRFLGYDSIYCESEFDEEILASTQNRILLTRDKQLILQAQTRGLTAINPGNPPIQHMLQRLHDALGIRFKADPNKSRCPHCNERLNLAAPIEVQSRVPQGSLQHHKQFWQCQNLSCQKIYWQGSHWTKIKDTLDKLNM